MDKRTVVGLKIIECLGFGNLFYVSGNAMRTVSMNKNYAMSIWIASILAAPILMLAIFALTAGAYWNVGFISFYILTVFVLVLFSLPSIFLHRLAFHELATSIKSEIKLKAILGLISILCLSFTFVIAEKAWDFGYDHDTLVPFLCFMFSVALSSFLFKTKAPNAMPIT